MRVTFLAEEADSKEATWKTTEVWDENGDEFYSEEKQVLVEKGKTYRGSCKDYNKIKGKGLIKPDTAGPWPAMGVKFVRSHIICDGSPNMRKGLRVQFQIVKEGSAYTAINVTLPGGRNIPIEGVKKKIVQKQPKKKVKKASSKTVVKKPKKKVKGPTTTVVPKPKKKVAIKKAKVVKKASKKRVIQKPKKKDPVKKPKKKVVVKKPKKKVVVKKPKKKDVVQKPQNSRKRKLAQESKTENPPTKKRKFGSDSREVPTFQKSKITSGKYGGMKVDENDIVEVGLLLRSNWIGGLIGRKGANVKQITELSGASLKIGDEDLKIAGSMCKVFAIAGTVNQTADACKAVTDKLADAAQSLEYKIVFLVPESFCGMFVGKKGSTINEIRGVPGSRIRVELSRDPITLPGSSRVTLCTIFGPRENMKQAIERTVAVLGAISKKLNWQMTNTRHWGDRDNGYRAADSNKTFHRGSQRHGEGARRKGRW